MVIRTLSIGYGYGYPIYRGGYYGRGYSYGAAGYGYSLGRGWSYNHRPIILGPGGGYSGAPVWGLGSRNSSIGYRNRGSFVSTRPGTSPLYGVSRFNVQRGPSRGVESPNRLGGRREMPLNTQAGFPDANPQPRPSNSTEMRPAPRNDGMGQAPTRVVPQVDSRATRVEPRAEPRSEPRAEPSERRAALSRDPSHALSPGRSLGPSRGRSRARSRVRSRARALRSVVVAAAAVVVADVVVAEAVAADAGHDISRKKSGTRFSGPAFLLREVVVQCERRRGRRTRRKKIPRSSKPIPIMSRAGRIVAVFGAIIPSATA